MTTEIEIGYYEKLIGQRFWANVDKRSFGECWYWNGYMGSSGYGRFWFNGKNVPAHRMAWMIRNNREIPEGMLALHTCDNKRCVNPYHIKVGTQTENVLDSMERTPYRMGMISRFHTGEVQLMRELYESGTLQMHIANKFKISRAHVSRLISGKRGTNVMPHIENIGD